MKTHVPRRALAILALCLWITPAFATVGPPLKLRLGGELQPVKAGSSISNVLRFEALADLELEGVQFPDDAWLVNAKLPPLPLRLTQGETLELPLDAFARDPSQFLQVRVLLRGKWYTRSFDLSDRAYQRSRGPLKTRPGPDLPIRGPVHGPVRTERPPGYAGPPETGAAKQIDESSIPATPPAARTIRVHGRFAYMRDDNALIGGDTVYVRIYENDGILHTLLADGMTNSAGEFDISFLWDPCSICEPQPDISVFFALTNFILETETTAGNDYTWEVGIWEDFTGTDLNVGTRLPDDEDEDPAVHLHTNIVRAYRWLGVYGFDTPRIHAIWPSGTADETFYTSDEIYVSLDHNWGEGVHSHEYGHHFQHHYSSTPSFDYCNGVCDNNPPDDCGHCVWCEEDEIIAWQEGFCDWFGDAIPRSFATVYGLAAAHPYNMESLHTCDGVLADPWLTEGFTAALLRDLEDASDDDHPQFAQGFDQVTMGASRVLDCVNLHNPSRTSTFLLDIKTDYPSYAEGIWDAAKNCGFNLDGTPPGVATNLRSTSHVAGEPEPSPDNTIDLVWDAAPDEFSGIDGYAIEIASIPQLPMVILNMGDVTSYTTHGLDPGVWYVSLRAADRAGNWSPNYASAGPYSIRAPEGADLEATVATGWAYPSVPRGTDDSWWNNVPAPVTLPGDELSTYWNACGINSGETTTGWSFENWLYADGTWIWWDFFDATPAGEIFLETNLGPVVMRGGRHTFEVRYDGSERVAESDETNNHWARQWIWSPYELTFDDRTTRSSPRNATGGWEYVAGTKWYNCDGMRIDGGSGSPWWNAVVMRPTAPEDDYDVRLHQPSTGADDGFASNLGYSARGAGMTDAVLVNRNISGNSHDWDVGVLDQGEGGAIYRIAHRGSVLHSFGDSVTYTMDEQEMLILREFHVGTEELGLVSVDVGIDPSDGPVWVAWFDESFSTGDLHDYDAITQTEPATGHARLDLDIDTVGYSCVVIYRDLAAGIEAMDVTLEIGPSPPDFAPYWAAGWHSPLVPRPGPDGTPSSVPAPPTLVGNASLTYVNVAVCNEGPGPGPGLVNHVRLDGTAKLALSYPTLAAGAWNTFNYSVPWFVRGGRHAITMGLDPDQLREEAVETNNLYGSQWIWSPYQLPLDTPVLRSAPPAMTGGWGDLGGAVLWYNCDGFRSSEFETETGYWNAIAVMPGTGSDVDVRLHEVDTSVTAGFASNLVRSSFGTGDLDYVMVNHNLTAFREFDAGVLQVSGSEDYTIEAVASEYLAADPTGTHGPYTLVSGHMLGLHEMRLSPGTWTITVKDTTPIPSLVIHWGATFHPADDPYLRRFDAFPGGDDWTVDLVRHTATATVVITEMDYYCLAVFKQNADDLGKKSRYEWTLANELTGVPDLPAVVSATRLHSIHPNPFNPRTTLLFDVATGGPVRVEIYSVRGERVRVLVDEALTVGRYERVWDGTDERGRRVASGVYVARLTAGDTEDRGRLVLLK